jgi:hypothetical protein
MRDETIRSALDRHWSASDAGDFETEHDIYLDDAVLEYPQSGARIRGRCNIRLTYDRKPSYTVSIMEFNGNKDQRLLPWALPSWRACTVPGMAMKVAVLMTIKSGSLPPTTALNT